MKYSPPVKIKNRLSGKVSVTGQNVYMAKEVGLSLANIEEKCTFMSITNLRQCHKE